MGNQEDTMFLKDNQNVCLDIATWEDAERHDLPTFLHYCQGYDSPSAGKFSKYRISQYPADASKFTLPLTFIPESPLDWAVCTMHHMIHYLIALNEENAETKAQPQSS